MKYVELMYDVLADTKVQEGIPSYLHNCLKSLVKHLLVLKISVTTLMIDSVKPDDGEIELQRFTMSYKEIYKELQ